MRALRCRASKLAHGNWSGSRCLERVPVGGPLLAGNVRNLPVSCAQAGVWHRVRIALLGGMVPLRVGNVRALRCHAPKLAHGNGFGSRCLGEFSHWSLAKAPASAGAGCQAGRGRRGPLPLLTGLRFGVIQSASRRFAVSVSAATGGQGVALLASHLRGWGAKGGRLHAARPGKSLRQAAC